MDYLGISTLFYSSTIFRRDRTRQKVGMQIMSEGDRQYSGRNCPGIYASGKQQEQEAGKNDEHCFVNRVGVPFNFKNGAP